MAVLVVEPDGLARASLSRLLRRQGYSPVLEAETMTQGLVLARQSRQRLRFLFSSCGVAQRANDCQTNVDGLALLREMERDDTFAFLPFILLVSGDEAGRYYRALRRGHPRLDAVLKKPFGLSGLLHSMRAAHSVRLHAGKNLLYVGGDQALVAILEEAVLSQAYWRRLERFDPLNQFSTPPSISMPSVPSVVILDVDPTKQSGPSLARWLGSFQKTAVGRRSSIICLNRSAESLGAFRARCQRFEVRPADREEARRLLVALRRRVDTSWERERLIRQWRRRGRGVDQASKDVRPWSFLSWGLSWSRKQTVESQARRLLRRDPQSSEAHCILAESQEQKGNRERAIFHYEQSLAVNPCLPRPYLRLLRLYSQVGNVERHMQTGQAALRFCPGHRQIRALAGAFDA